MNDLNFKDNKIGRMISMICAVANNGVIGNKNQLPWPHLPSDMKWFSKQTKGNVVVMGRKTWDSLGLVKPLPNRVNVVVSRRDQITSANAIITGNVNQRILDLQQEYPTRDIFIIGGAQLYRSTMPITKKFYITRIYSDYPGDTYLDIEVLLEDTEMLHQKAIEASEKHPKHAFQIFQRVT